MPMDCHSKWLHVSYFYSLQVPRPVSEVCRYFASTPLGHGHQYFYLLFYLTVESIATSTGFSQTHFDCRRAFQRSLKCTNGCYQDPFWQKCQSCIEDEVCSKDPVRHIGASICRQQYPGEWLLFWFPNGVAEFPRRHLRLTSFKCGYSFAYSPNRL